MRQQNQAMSSKKNVERVETQDARSTRK